MQKQDLRFCAVSRLNAAKHRLFGFAVRGCCFTFASLPNVAAIRLFSGRGAAMAGPLGRMADVLAEKDFSVSMATEKSDRETRSFSLYSASPVSNRQLVVRPILPKVWVKALSQGAP
jgi:hypothetical protein